MTQPEPDPTNAPSNRRGLAFVLAATVVAGGIGYLIQAVVPRVAGQGEYLVFAALWSAVYLVVSALSGVQQEVTRASHRADGPGPSISAVPTLWRLTGLVGLAAAVVVACSSPLWAPHTFPSAAPALVAAVAVAALGYTSIAVLSGALYGIRNWPGVAAMTATDSVVRLATILLALAAGAGVVALGWAVALPFAIAVAILWAATGRAVAAHLTLSAPVRTLARNSVATVGAGAATGVMISGLPFLLGLTAGGTDPGTLASLILVITLTRAPLVIPILALQSYLVVTFRDAPARARARVIRWSVALLGLTAVLSAAAIAVGPWVITLVYGDRYSLPAGAYAAIVASAGLTGLVCLTGPAVLAAGRHAAYLGGWIAASGTLVLILVVSLALPISGLARVLAAIVVAPVVGVIVHAGALRPAAPPPTHT